MEKIILPSQDFIRIVNKSDIIYCKSNDCYTNVHLQHEEVIIVCKPLVKVSADLKSEQFIRVNQSYIVNRNCIKIIHKKRKVIELENCVEIPFTCTLRYLLSGVIDGI